METLSFTSVRDSSDADSGTEGKNGWSEYNKLCHVSTKLVQLTLLGLCVGGGGGVLAYGQSARKEHAHGGRLVFRVGKAGVPATAAQRLVGKGALQRAPGGLQGRTVSQQQSVDPFVISGFVSFISFDPINEIQRSAV